MKQRIKIEEKKLVKYYIEDNLSAREIAKIYDTTQETISRKLRELNDERITDKINKNKRSIKIEESCIICKRSRNDTRVYRIDGVVYCNAHYYQMMKHGEIIKESIGFNNEYVSYDSHYEIVLFDKHGKEVARTEISLNKIDIVKSYQLHLNSNGYVGGYSYCESSKKKILLHRIIINAKDGEIVDHINGDKLDNRNENLRICTTSQNGMNSKNNSRSSSGVRGVTYDPTRDKWRVYLSKDGVRYFLGRFNDFDEAIKVRKDAEEKYFGEFKYGYFNT